MKKVLITGGAGFIGANFVHKFLDLVYNVHVIEKEGTNLWRINNVKNKVNIHYIDLTNYGALESFILHLKPKIILHFTTYGAYQSKQQDIHLTVDTNVKASISLINACQKIGVECFINTGSNSEYGIKEYPMKEDDMLEPDNLYAITKSAITLYGQMMAKKYDFPIVTMRPFAVYGYFEEKERLVPTIIKACLTNSKLGLSRPDFVRDFIFIEDLIDGYLKAVENIENIKGHVFNLGSGKQTAINEMVKIVNRIIHSKIKPEYGQIKIAQTEPKTWVADISKARKMLQWKPKYNLEKGLKKNIGWFKKNISYYE